MLLQTFISSVKFFCSPIKDENGSRVIVGVFLKDSSGSQGSAFYLKLVSLVKECMTQNPAAWCSVPVILSHSAGSVSPHEAESPPAV